MLRTVLIVISLANISQNGVPQQPINIDVCTLVQHPELYSKKVVRVKAFIAGTGVHGLNLVDESCNNVGINFEPRDYRDRPIHIVRNKEYRKLRSFLSNLTAIHADGSKVYGTFEGFFRWEPSSTSRGNFVLSKVYQVYEEPL
jgi:hypothetical protein